MSSLSPAGAGVDLVRGLRQRLWRRLECKEASDRIIPELQPARLREVRDRRQRHGRNPGPEREVPARRMAEVVFGLAEAALNPDDKRFAVAAALPALLRVGPSGDPLPSRSRLGQDSWRGVHSPQVRR